jgi:hypothetical protein
MRITHVEPLLVDPQNMEEASMNSAEGADRLGTLGHRPRLWIDGKWQDARDGRTFAVCNPSDGTVVANVALAGEAETREAVDAAARAFERWRRVPVLERADMLWRIVELLREHREALAQLATLEQGAALSWTRGGVDYAISFFRWYAEEARRIYGRTIQHPDPRRRLRVQYDPIGVGGVITPWNGPLFSPAKKVARALAAGCTVVIKPAELTPLSTSRRPGSRRRRAFPRVFSMSCAATPRPSDASCSTTRLSAESPSPDPRRPAGTCKVARGGRSSGCGSNRTASSRSTPTGAFIVRPHWRMPRLSTNTR